MGRGRRQLPDDNDGDDNYSEFSGSQNKQKMAAVSHRCQQDEDEDDEGWGETMTTLLPAVTTRAPNRPSHENGNIHRCHPDDEDEDWGAMTTAMVMTWTTRITGTTNTPNKATRTMTTWG